MCVCNLSNVFRFFFGPARLWTVKAIRLLSMTYLIFLEMYEALIVFAFLSVAIPRLKLCFYASTVLAHDIRQKVCL